MAINETDSFDFNFKDITNGGANRFWYDEKRGDFMVAGSDVGGRERYDDVNDYLTRAAELYDGDITKGAVNYDGTGELQFSLIGEDMNVVKFGPGNHGGSAQITFDSQKEAENFLDLVNLLDDVGFL